MRVSTIVACLLLMSPSSALACFEHAAEQTGWLHEVPSASRILAGAGAEEASMLGVRFAGAGLASMALAVVAFRGLSRARRGRVGAVDFEPAVAEGPSSTIGRPGDARIRVDPGHEPWEPTRVDRNEEALSGALAVR